jgi:hypothetical protein
MALLKLRAARVLAACGILAVLAWSMFRSEPTFAQAPQLAEELKFVPADAAVFAHLEMATIWDSPIGETFRKAKARDLDSGLKFAEENLGVKPEMVDTITVYMPTLKQGTDISSFVTILKFRKPFDSTKTKNYLKTLVKELEAKYREENGVVTLEGAGQKLRMAFDNPNRVIFSMNVEEKYTKPQPADQKGVLSDAIQSASKNTATVGLNWANFPDELRSMELPPEVRPYAPIIKTDSLLVTLKLEKKDVAIGLKASSQERAKVAEAEKSFGAGLNFLKVIGSLGMKELDKQKEKDIKALAPMLEASIKMLDMAKVSMDETSAMVTSKLSADFPYGAGLEQMLGGRIGDASSRAVVTNNLKQIALALHNYHDVNGGFPPAALCDKKGKPLLSWRVLILPYIEQNNLYKQFHLDEPWDSEHNKKLSEVLVKTYMVPGLNDEKNKNCHIRVFRDNGAMFDLISPTKMQKITDGTSNTGLLFVTSKGVPWTKPDDEEFDPKAEDLHKLLWWQRDVTVMAFGDGSVSTIPKSIKSKNLKALITKAGGEIVNIDE